MSVEKWRQTENTVGPKAVYCDTERLQSTDQVSDAPVPAPHLSIEPWNEFDLYFFVNHCRIIRIEFNHKHLEYFTEIDGVELTGLKYNFDRSNDALTEKEQFYRLHPNKGPIQRRLESVQFKPVAHENRDVLKDFLIKDLENFIAEINSGSGSSCNEIIPDYKEDTQFTLKNLPVSRQSNWKKTNQTFWIPFSIFFLF